MSSLEKKEFLELLSKHHMGTASPEEEAFLDAYFNIFELDPEYISELTFNQQQEINVRLKAKIDNDISLEKSAATVQFKRNDWKWLSIAASAIILTFATLYLYKKETPAIRNIAASDKTQTPIQPGGNKATLTLADGTKISLTDAANGHVHKTKGINITKTADGELVYQVLADNTESPSSFNTIQTPKGGQYQISLPDGTKVFLNAASSLKFPSTFENAEERLVELKGEAYFEVAHTKDQPFKVVSTGQEIVVLGTHFNINAYSDEPSTITTLVEGSVRVSHNNQSKLIEPGQQSAVKDGIKISRAQENALAWRNGIISFDRADIRTIMRQVSRWYDIDVDYEGTIPTRSFTGEISRNSTLSELLKILEFSKIKFKLNKRRLTVTQ